MIKDKNDHPVACLTITTALRDEMMSTIQMRIIHNLEAIKEFLKIQGYEDVCAGLYTYAIEEYGKILFLKAFPVSAANEITFPYNRDGAKGFLNHHEKFPRALDDKQLPDSCKMLREGDFSADFDSDDDFNTEIAADFDARMALFYADFKDQNSILEPPPADSRLLQKAVDDFLTVMRKQIFL
jgi:hypothetical protein